MAPVMVIHAFVGPGAVQVLASLPVGSTYQFAAEAVPAPMVKSAAAMAEALMVFSLLILICVVVFVLWLLVQ
jgi:predicted secreted protein